MQSLRSLLLLSLVFLSACSTTDVGEPPSGAAADRIVIKPPLPPPPIRTARDTPSLAAIASRYAKSDKDGDGISEIDSLTLSSLDDGRGPGLDGVVLVLVEKRILASGGLVATLKSRLATWRDDLGAEGLAARFVEADLYDGPAHRDGLTVLGLRDS